MTTLQKPDNISDEDWEDLLEEHAELHPTDNWDTMEQIRLLLNSSKLQAMHMIKKQSRLGNQCPYYIKARTLFDRETKAELFSLLEQFREEVENET